MIKKLYRVGVYLRLSREDGDNMESESIKNQRELLKMFLDNKDDLCYVDCYIDDGYTGSNFDRPAWKRLFNDIDNGRIDAIAVKDLSRMGRDYISMGEYIERIFPERGIRFIAVNDDIDTLYETPGLEFLQFKLIFNDYYLKDTSKKIRRVIRSKKEQGQFLGWKAIYGYKKDINDKHKLVIDEEVRGNVVRMFNLVLEGKSPRQIADIFSCEKIPTPSRYAKLKVDRSNNLWSSRTIEEMLTNEIYIGNLIQGKRKKINYKSKKEVRTKEEEWIINKNVNPAIIDKNTFYLVQDLLKKGRYIIGKRNSYLLAGFMYCLECGHAIGINKSSDGKRMYCCCTYYATHSKFKLCTPHSCNYLKLESAIIDSIRKICCKYVDRKRLEDKIKMIILRKEENVKERIEIERIDKEISDNLLYSDMIYEDKLKGNIDIEMFSRVKCKYDKRIEKLKIEREKLEERLSNIDKKVDVSKVVEEMLSFNNLKRNLMVSLIDKILISEDKRIFIYYKFRCN